MLDTVNTLCIIACEMGIKNGPNRVKSRSGRIMIFVLLNIFLFVCLSASGLTGHAAIEPASETESDLNGSFKSYIPLISAVQLITNCRYGANIGSDQGTGMWMDFLGAGHYINFGPQVEIQSIPESVELLPLIRLRQNKQNGQFLPSYAVDPPLTMDSGGLGPIVKANLGSTWLVGNEPDVDNPYQDHTHPEWYARGYHEVYYFIKEIDPRAQIAVAGLSMMTPGRLQYLDIVWDTYKQEFGEPMPVDVWNMHLYILAEIKPWDGTNSDGKVALGTNPNLARKEAQAPYDKDCPKNDVYCRAEHDDIGIFADQINALRSWMEKHGQQNKPLLLSEFSQLYPYIIDYDNQGNPIGCYLRDEFGQCFTPQRVTNFLNKTMDYLESARDSDLGYPADDYHLVQQWTWYSMIVLDDLTGQSSNLLVDGYKIYQPGTEAALTQVGRAYRGQVNSSERTLNLVAGEAPVVEAKAVGGTADVELGVWYYNNGSTGILDPFEVTFYKNAALTQVIGEAKVSPRNTGVINGCSWGRLTDQASVTWKGVPVGTHTFWAKIDSNNRIIGETNEADNVVKGQVNVNP